MRVISFVLLATSFLATSKLEANPSMPPFSRVAQHGIFSVKQLVVPDFEKLPPRRKLFVYYLAQAMEATRDISWMQLSRNGLRIRKLFESIWPRFVQLDPKVRESLEEYYFKLLLEHGPYDRGSNSKNVLSGMRPEEFINLVHRLGGLREEARQLIPDIFNPNFEPFRTAPEGADRLADSGTDFYGPGVTMAKFSELPIEKQNHSLSYPYLDAGGKIRLQPYSTRGRFSEQLQKATKYLEVAKKYADDPEIFLISAYQKSLRTGSLRDFERAQRLWARYHSPDVTFVLGFMESYDDPLQIRGTWEGFILLKSSFAPLSRHTQAIHDHLQDFEELMPVAGFVTGTSHAASLVWLSGGADESGFRGVNLPNISALRSQYGSQSFSVINRIFDVENEEDSFDQDILDLFYLPLYHASLKQFGKSLPRMLQTEFHEIFGHGSGREHPEVRQKLGPLYAVVEEARAEVASLYYLTHPARLLNYGILPAEWRLDDATRFAQTVILEFFTLHLQSLDTPSNQTAHQLAGQILFQEAWRRGALTVNMSPRGIPRIVLGPLDLWRLALADMWETLQRIKDEGDFLAMQGLVESSGAISPAQKRWTEAITKASEKLQERKYVLYLNPVFRLICNRLEQPVNVEIEYEEPSDWRVVFRREQFRRASDYRRDCELALMD